MTDGGFRDLDLRIAYTTVNDPLNTFYVPVLSRARRYDRSAGFFSSWSLVIAAQGVAGLIQNGGTMRLAVGAKLSPNDVEAIERGESLKGITTERLLEVFADPEEELATKRLEVLAWMIAAGTLEIQVVLPKGPDGRLLAYPVTDEYFHQKLAVFEDAEGDRVAFSGSVNETPHGWQKNLEQFMVYRSWIQGQTEFVKQVEYNFRDVWESRLADWQALSIPDAVKDHLLRYKPSAPPKVDPLAPSPVPPVPVQLPRAEDAILARFLLDAPNLLDVGPAIGRATSVIRPWPHQLIVGSELVRSFPERYLLADEVGLGKTIEAGLALRDLLVSGEISRCLILTPKSVLKQWQGELREKFALEVPIYDGHDLIGPEPEKVVHELRGARPWNEAPVMLMSSQLAKRRDRRAELLDGPDWDLVIVDEAHHARRKDFLDLSLRRPNRLLELLEGAEGRHGLAGKTRGLLLLTATPMQVNPVEVWDLLSQLGMGGRWGASWSAFIRYFDALRRAATDPIKAEWPFLAAMARDELEYGGPIGEQVESVLEEHLGFAAALRVKEFPSAVDPAVEAKAMTQDERTALLALLRHLTPLRRRMFRFTRALLKLYQAQGLLPGKIAERDPESRWIKFTSAEADLYRRVDEYISHFYKKYEGERKGLGFVMTVYRRRLTSSFSSLEKSLERRLAYLRGETTDVGLTDEDIEEGELEFDVDEELEAPELRALDRLRAEEIRYVEDFIGELRTLGTDSKFDQLVNDLNRALAKRDSVVVFTQYVDTMDYLKEKLRPVYGKRLATYAGRGGEWWNGLVWEPVGKEDIKKAFKDGDVQILLGTDAMAEGLNLQTSGVEINYDAPWNPMRLEQRIGRIDRINQTHDVVWIWTYFYEDSVEAEVYRRLEHRINWFTGVVGPLQPILYRVERIIRNIAMADAETRQRLLEQELRDLEAAIDQAAREGFDLDALLDQEVKMPPPIPIGFGWRDLQDALLGTTLSPRFGPHPDIEGVYLLEDGAGVLPVTFDPDVYDVHSDSVELLTIGHPTFRSLLEGLARQLDTYGHGLARAATVGTTRASVAWYACDGDQPERIDGIPALRERLDSGGTREVLPEIVAQAEEDFALAVTRRLEDERAAKVKQLRERLSAAQERGMDVLRRAAYWTAIGNLEREGTAALSEVTVQAMVAIEGYPFAPLAAKLQALPSVSTDDAEWQEFKDKNARQLEGLWQSAGREAERVVRQILDAESLLADAEMSIDVPEIEIAL